MRPTWCLQEEEVGFFAECLNGQGDGVTADISTSNMSGRSLTLTAGVPLGRQRHSVLSARAGASSYQAPHLNLTLENRWRHPSHLPFFQHATTL